MMTHFFHFLRIETDSIVTIPRFMAILMMVLKIPLFSIEVNFIGYADVSIKDLSELHTRIDECRSQKNVELRFAFIWNYEIIMKSVSATMQRSMVILF